MIDWFTGVQVFVAMIGGVIAIVLGLAGRKPNDFTMAFTGVVALLLIVQLAVAIASPMTGNQPSGNLFEFYIYLISAILLPIAAAFWALLERSRWSTVVLGVAMLSVAVMVYRMSQIWFVQAA